MDSSLKTGVSTQDAPALDAVSLENPDRPAESAAVPRAPVESPSREAELILERSAQPFAVIDFNGRFVRVNHAFEQLTGYSSEELTSLSLEAITPEKWHETGRKILAQVRATGNSARYEKEYLRKDGTLIPVEALADLNRDERDEPIGFSAFVTDIGERKRVENALRDSEERFRRLYDEAPVGYHVIDTEGYIQSMNKTECEMLGYTREEVIGKLVFDFITPESRAQALAAFPRKIRGDQPLRTIERTIETRDGRRLVVAIEERYKRDELGRVVGIRSTVQDITDRKRTEAALVASERRARVLFEGIEDAVFVHARTVASSTPIPAACRLLSVTAARNCCR